MAGLWDSIQNALNTANAHVAQGMSSPLFNLGMGMVAGGTGLTNPGQAMQGAANNYLTQQAQRQQNAMQQLQMQLMYQQYPLLQQALSQAGGLMGGPQPNAAPAAPQAPAGGLLGVAQTPGQTAVAAPAGNGASAVPALHPGSAGGSAGNPSSSGPDPFALLRSGTMLSAFPMTQKLGAAEIDAAKTMIANDPGMATRLAAARSPLAVATAQYQQALAGSDPDAVQRAYTNLRNVSGQEHVGSMSGIMTMQLPNGNWATVNPSTGLRTVINPQLLANAPEGAEWLPGEVSAIRTRAAAEAGGEGAGQAPYEMERVTDPQGNTYLVPKSQLLAPGTPGSAPGATAGPALAGLGPQAAAGLHGRGMQSADYVSELQKAADDATTSNYALDNVVQAARGATLGPGAPAREFVEKSFTALAQTLDPAFTPPKELGNYQELAKYGNQLGFATARTMGSREAAQIVNMAIQSNPNKELTPQAFGWIANSMKAMNNYIIAKNQAISGADKRSPGTAQQAGATWNAKVEPQVWDLSLDPAMAATLAPKIGAAKIASSMPFMSSADAVTAFRNIPASMRASVLSKLPPAAKQELAAGLRQ
jgi:hypothetical protein